MRETFFFGDWQVEPAANTLRRGKQLCQLEPKAMDVLVLLCLHAGEVVSADDIVSQCWPGTDTGDNPLHKTITQLRKALGDSATNPNYIETIRKRGYRTVAEVRFPLGKDQSVQAHSWLQGSPFPGLQAYDERYASVFFGRGAQIDTLLQRIAQQIQYGRAFCLLLGPSGSGKTTLLRWVLGEPLVGFEQQGELWLNDQRIDHYPIHQRKIGLLYQKGDLFPHLSVKENLLFALPRKYNKQQKQQRSEQALATIELTSKRNAMPHQLSGGEQSRIALIRSLLAEPEALLLDEPFSALDTGLRASIRQWTFAQIKQRNIPALLVTHDEFDHGDGPIINLGNQHA